ncbi:MAG: hypothetical protein H6Q70_3762 [Firmicutes bacterium]|nr:hypothetical protein [Bacillota bacterium]
MHNEDIKCMLETTLEDKQEHVRDYQEFADKIYDSESEIAKMFKHFAEGEALHAVRLKEALDKLV